jgi:hypothetical protein
MKTFLACLAFGLALPASVHAGPHEVAAGGLPGERVVKGAPYCADATHEAVQTLADGNRIVHRSTERLCRDGEGRTRREHDSGGRTQVWLRDPVAGEAWLLDPQRKTARMFSLEHDAAPPLLDASAWREYGERMREWAQHLAERVLGEAGSQVPAPQPQPQPQPPAPPPEASSPSAAAATEPGTAGPRMAGQVPPGDPLVLPLPPGMSWRTQSVAPRGPGTVTPLPPREIEGLQVNGERTTWTIEAGRIGNEKPIVSTREVWTSPELMLTVLTREADPRSGETTYRMTNVRRGEPDPVLMKVPPDYETVRVRTPRAPTSPAARQ